MLQTPSRALCAALAVVLCALGPAPGAPLRAQELPDTLSLEALLAAVDASPGVRAASLGAAAAAARARGAGLRPDPEFDVMVRPGALLGAEGERFELRATQPLAIPSRLRAERASAAAAADAERLRVGVEAADRRLRVRLAYYMLYRAQQQEGIVRAYVARLGAFAEAAAVRYEVGRGPQGAILQAQLEAGRLEEELRALSTMRHDALAELSAVLGFHSVGQHVEEHVEGPIAVATPPVPPQPDTALVARALRDRPEIAALAAEARAADAEVELARLAFRADVGVSVSLMSGSSDGFIGANALGVGAMVRIPVNRRQLRARVEEAGLRRARVDALRDVLAAEIEASVAHHSYAARREAETIALYERRLLPHAQTTVESLLAAYTTGQTDLLDLLDAERARFQLAMGVEESRYRYLVALSELARAVGEEEAAINRTP